MVANTLWTAKAVPALVLGLCLSACTGTAYSGPVEVTRFVGELSAPAAQNGERGEIAITFPREMKNERARNAFYNAVAAELSALGYTVIAQDQMGVQTARVETSRNELAPASSRGPVNVGVGGSTGSYGSGLGLGIGINLGGNTAKPNALTKLSVRISDRHGNSLWEGRAQQAVSINSPYAEIEASAAALAKALFKDFPGGNGETISISPKDLQE
ncbi:DUF4136 domain-containing protein [Erythrobacter sp. SCSIO 43205]|uniref:DUF4136 domain-containing protein n=1 Tax=Erythrobacter sp. SCSIO 43205 TaxID=2779361 RepID=UPI001CA94A1E|nr:DUF4136 domain-containing protein [Erythrobacter sp. SCSIO 43205]UAB78212.1 DUF4136 domain-containing protein [Erythrobacter sp. SCSIO 43205]